MLAVKNPLAKAEDIRDSGFNSWVGKIPGRRAWQPTPLFLPRESSWTEKPGGLQSIGLQKIRQDWATKHSAAQRGTKEPLDVGGRGEWKSWPQTQHKKLDTVQQPNNKCIINSFIPYKKVSYNIDCCYLTFTDVKLKALRCRIVSLKLYN